MALSAEMDELNHKAILDSFFLVGTANDNQNVQDANNVLVGGSFMGVVRILGEIVITGDLNKPAQINEFRCRDVLPAIDAYSLAVAVATGASEYSLAVRPLACQ
ncbi:hypothetical protein BDZ45DRAFT_184784, partial [Acephala macrosclerotiorum]